MLLMYGYKIVTTEFGLKSTELIKPSSRRVQYTDLVATRKYQLKSKHVFITKTL